MSLFHQLRCLYPKDRFPLENFHTEIVAQVLRNSLPLTLEWLHGIKATGLPHADSHEIVTQENFPRLAGHATDSRPDIAIRLREGGQTELILVESKVQAKEGPDQLTRYAEQLAARGGSSPTSLVFITRDFYPDQAARFAGMPPRFLQTRWFKFYKYLEAHLKNGDGLATQLKLFMKEYRMSMSNHFKPVDMVALEYFLGAKALMDDTLWSEVKKKFEDTLGKARSPNRAMSQLASHGRYVLLASFGDQWDFECDLGYWLPSGDPAGTVLLGAHLGAKQKSEIGKLAISAFRSLSKETNGSWEPYNLDHDSGWACITKTRSLQEFMNQSDHIKAIKDYFLQLLNEVESLKKAHPELPWNAHNADSDEDAA